jgi:hypothetical protein
MLTYLSQPNVVKAAANLSTLLFSIFIGAQLLLAAGVLPITMFWGGRQTELTPVLRVASLVSAAALILFIYIIRYRAGLAGSPPIPRWIRAGAWVVTGYMVLNMVGNFASTSSVERMLFGPLTLLLAIACLIVALSPVDAPS